jgi:hypothetical protein
MKYVTISGQYQKHHGRSSRPSASEPESVKARQALRNAKIKVELASLFPPGIDGIGECPIYWVQ